MKPGNSSCLVQIYHYLLRLYPAEFLAEFGQEMEAVFSEAITEAHEKGFGSVLILFLRELRDLPSSLWRELRRRRQNHKQTFALANGINGPGYWQPATVLETAVTVLPFVLSGLMFTYEALGYAGFTRGLMSDWYLRLYLVALAGFGSDSASNPGVALAGFESDCAMDPGVALAGFESRSSAKCA